VRLGAPIDKVTVTMKNGTIYTYDANILDYNVHHNYSKKYRLANASIATSDYAGANKYNSFPFQEELNYAPNTTDVTNGATYYMTNVQNVVISYTNGQSEQLDCTGVTNWSGG
jgi:hypothetical protein